MLKPEIDLYFLYKICTIYSYVLLFLPSSFSCLGSPNTICMNSGNTRVLKTTKTKTQQPKERCNNSIALWLTFILHPVKIRQFGGCVDGFGGLQGTHHSVHQENVCQRLLDILRILKTKQLCCRLYIAHFSQGFCSRKIHLALFTERIQGSSSAKLLVCIIFWSKVENTLLGSLFWYVVDLRNYFTELGNKLKVPRQQMRKNNVHF